MSLLDKASLIITPNAYKESKLYSVIPSNGDGDMTVVRATTATRVNADGLIETPSFFGSELVTNGDFATDTDWTKGTGVTISGGSLNFSGVLSSVNTYQSSSIEIGKRYLVTFTISNYTSGGIRAIIGSLGFTDIRTSNGTFTTDVVASGNTTIYLQSQSGTSTYSIDNVSVKEVITNNIPRIDYTGGGCPSILLEPQRTNLITYSEQFDNVAWAKNNAPTITTNIATAPDGYGGADGIQAADGTNFKSVGKNLTVSANSTVTGSVFIKKETSETAFGGMGIVFQGGTTKTCYTIFNAVTGTGLISGSSLTGTIKVDDYGNYWRLQVTTTDNGSNTTLNFSYYATLSLNGVSINTGAGSVRTVWGAQLEVGSTATSYFPTTDRLNIPRIDYTDGGCGKLLLEPQRTNSVLRSEAISTSPWTTYFGITTDNETISPDGTQNASKVIMGSGNQAVLRQAIGGLTNGSPYTFSLYIKQGSGVTAFLDIGDAASTVNITPTSEWVRYTYAANWSTTNNFIDIELRGTSGSAYCYIYGAQLEAGSYATSYIPTVASSVTRNADVISKTGISSLINSTEGVFYAEIAGENDGTFNYISLSDGSTTNYAGILYTDIDNEIIYRYYGAGTQIEITALISDLTSFNKIAIKWKANDFALWINGVKVGSATSGAVHSSGVFDTLALARGGSNNTPFYGNVQNLMVFPSALTDTELETLTSWASFSDMANSQNYTIK